MQFNFCTCTHGERCPACSNEQTEPTIKVSELREWCEANIETGNLDDFERGMKNAFHCVINKFCKEAS